MLLVEPVRSRILLKHFQPEIVFPLLRAMSVMLLNITWP